MTRTEWYEKNKERVKAKQREWYKNNKEKAKEYMRNTARKKALADILSGRAKLVTITEIRADG